MIEIKQGSKTFALGLEWQELKAKTAIKAIIETGNIKSCLIRNKKNQWYSGFSKEKVTANTQSGAALLAKIYPNGLFLFNINDQVWFVEIQDNIVRPGSDIILDKYKAMKRLKYLCKTLQQMNSEVLIFGDIDGLEEFAKEQDLIYKLVDFDSTLAKMAKKSGGHIRSKYSHIYLSKLGLAVISTIAVIIASIAVIYLNRTPTPLPTPAPVTQTSAEQRHQQALNQRKTYARSQYAARLNFSDFTTKVNETIRDLPIHIIGWRLDTIVCQAHHPRCLITYQNNNLGYNSDILKEFNDRNENINFDLDGKKANFTRQIDFNANDFSIESWQESLIDRETFINEMIDQLQTLQATDIVTFTINESYPLGPTLENDWNVSQGQFNLRSTNWLAFDDLGDSFDNNVYWPVEVTINVQRNDSLRWNLIGNYLYE